jgi:hypothetical protein
MLLNAILKIEVNDIPFMANSDFRSEEPPPPKPAPNAAKPPADYGYYSDPPLPPAKPRNDSRSDEPPAAEEPPQDGEPPPAKPNGDARRRSKARGRSPRGGARACRRA